METNTATPHATTRRWRSSARADARGHAAACDSARASARRFHPRTTMGLAHIDGFGTPCARRWTVLREPDREPESRNRGRRLRRTEGHGSRSAPPARARRAFACVSTIRPLRRRMTRSAMAAMAALWVMTAVVVPSSRLTRSSTSQHQLAGLVVERAGGLVAQQHLGPLGDGAGDGDALLLAAGELRRKVVEALAEADQLAAPPRARIGAARDLGDQRDVLARGQARDQVVELEDEADVLAPVAGQLRPRRRRSGRDRESAPSRCVGTSRPPRMLSSVDLPLPDGPSRTTSSPR